MSNEKPNSNPELKNKKPMTYKDSGVDIHAGTELVSRIKKAVQKTRRPEVLSGLGGFGALCEIPSGYNKPILVSSTDGVGTKLKLAMEFSDHSTIGIDLVAMCVNDLVVTGAEPLQFLDYYATGKLELDVAEQVIESIADGCLLAGCALVGGETAEMPGMYSDGDYDLAGFCVGVVEKTMVIDGSSVSNGDQLIALPSSGVHSNGYSLVRRILSENNIDAQKTTVGGKLLSELLLEPTRIYVKPLLKLFRKINVHSVAHITGGGITENLPRVLPENYKAVVNKQSWKQPELFNWLQQHANIDETEMLKTFNCGIGMILAVAEADLENCMELLNSMNEPAFVLGSIASKTDDEAAVEFV